MMDIALWLRDILAIFAKNKDGIDAAVKAGGAVGSLGSAAVTLFDKGKQIYTFWVTRTSPKPAASSRRHARVSNSKWLTKPHVAIVVAITQPALDNVAAFLDKKKIDADLVLVTNVPTYGVPIKRLSDDAKEWEQTVKEFARTMEKVRREARDAKKVHIFLSAPVALTFAMGAVWGTVNEAVVYHWDGKTYLPVVKVSRDLKMPGE